MNRLCIVALGIALALGVSAGAAHAQKRKLEVLERVAAIVDDEIILLSELRRRAIPYLTQVMEAPSAVEREARLNQLYGQLLERMIDEALLQQAAIRMKVRVTREEVDRAIANVRTQHNLEESAFWDAVLTQGMTESDYRRDVRRQLLSYKVLNARAGDRVQISEDQIRSRYEERAARESRTIRVRLHHLFLPLPADASAKQLAEVRTKMEELRKTVTKDNFESVATSHPGGDLGWINEGDLPEALRSAVVGMKVAEISGLVRGPNGFHILFVVERDRGTGSFPSYEEARQQIYREMIEKAMARQQEIVLEELRRGAVVEKRL